AWKTGPRGVVNVSHLLARQSKLDPVGSITLGTQDVTPLDMATGYATLAAHGMRRYPSPIEQIKSPTGKVLAQPNRPGKQVIPANVANMSTYTLEGVIQHGTGTAAN